MIPVVVTVVLMCLAGIQGVEHGFVVGVQSHLTLQICFNPLSLHFLDCKIFNSSIRVFSCQASFYLSYVIFSLNLRAFQNLVNSQLFNCHALRIQYLRRSRLACSENQTKLWAHIFAAVAAADAVAVAVLLAQGEAGGKKAKARFSYDFLA